MIAPPPDSTLVRPFQFPEVANCLATLNLGDLSETTHFRKSQIQERCRQAAHAVLDWIRPVINIPPDWHIYPVSGITHALDLWLLDETRPIFMLRGDYAWLHRMARNIHLLDRASELPAESVFYISNPSAIDGRWIENWEQLLRQKSRLSLDLAYIGTAESRSIPMTENVERVFFSFSKSLGIPGLRCGWYFSTQAVPRLELLQEVGYLPTAIIETTQLLCAKFPLQYAYERLRSRQLEVCKKNAWEPAHSVLIALAEGSHYPKFQRNPHHPARLPLAAYYSSAT